MSLVVCRTNVDMSDFCGSGGGGECDRAYDVVTMFAVRTPAGDAAGDDDDSVVVDVLVVDGMTEIPRVNDDDDSLLLKGVGTVSRMDTRSRDEVRDRLEVEISGEICFLF